MEQFATVTAKELASALTKCTADVGVIGRARDFGAALRNEDGLGCAVMRQFRVDELIS